MFPAAAGDLQRLYNNVAGVSVAMLGVILYGHLKQASKTPDDSHSTPQPASQRSRSAVLPKTANARLPAQLGVILYGHLKQAN